MANYIKTLQDENAQLRNDKAEAQQVLTDLLAYLESSKFVQDTTVQVADVARRIAPARNLLVA